MKVEFIIDKNDYKALLSENAVNAHIKRDDKKVKGKCNYLLMLSNEGKNVKTAKLLSDCRIEIEKIFSRNNVKYRLLIDESSQFFVERLYTYACEFETKLRKFIYTALFDIDEKAEGIALDKFNGTLRKKGEDKSCEKLPQNDFLADRDLGQIFDFLFSNNEFFEAVKKINLDDSNNKNHNCRLTKQKFIEQIKQLEEKTIWNLFFASHFPDSVLPSVYEDLQKFRNDIMHMHYISYSDYVKAHKIYNRVIKDLNNMLNKEIVIDDTKSNVDTLANNINFMCDYFGKVQNILRSMQLLSSITSLEKQYAQLQSNLTAIALPIGALTSQSDELGRLYKGICIDPSLNETIRLLKAQLSPIAISFGGDKKYGE